jgi:protein SCO1/2
MTKRTILALVSLLLIASPGSSIPAPVPAECNGAAQEPIKRAIRTDPRSEVVIDIHDVDVVDHHGRKLRFYTDLLKDKVFVLNFFFASCTYICPMQGRLLSRLQEKLGDRLGVEVHMISVTTDPVRDTPERLNKWAADHGVRRGWTLVTGNRREFDKLLPQFTGDYSGPREGHGSALYVGNDQARKWIVVGGLLEPQQVLEALHSLGY